MCVAMNNVSVIRKTLQRLLVKQLLTLVVCGAEVRTRGILVRVNNMLILLKPMTTCSINLRA